jgi:hypothetical protein
MEYATSQALHSGTPSFIRFCTRVLGFLPLYPDVAPETAAQPLVPAFQGILHPYDFKVAKPSLNIAFYLCHDHTDVSVLTAGSQPFERLLCFLQGLCVDTDTIKAAVAGELWAKEQVIEHYTPMVEEMAMNEDMKQHLTLKLLEELSNFPMEQE